MVTVAIGVRLRSYLRKAMRRFWRERNDYYIAYLWMSLRGDTTAV